MDIPEGAAMKPPRVLLIHLRRLLIFWITKISVIFQQCLGLHKGAMVGGMLKMTFEDFLTIPFIPILKSSASIFKAIILSISNIF